MLKIYAAVFVLLSTSSPALGQTAATVSRAAATTMETGRDQGSMAGGWMCAASSSFEISEVSTDVATEKASYVLIHRVKGEPVASQRLTPAEVEAFRRLGCKSEIATTEMAAVIG